MELKRLRRLRLLLKFALAGWVVVGQPEAVHTAEPPPEARPTREQIDIERRVPARPSAPVGSELPVISGPDERRKGAPTPTVTFRLNGVNVTRATIYDADDFAPLYKEFIGAQVTLGNLREIADRIEQLYRDAGYVATRAVIPPQSISEGVPTIEVYEGRIVRYEINGDIGPVKKQIATLLDNLVTGQPARWSELERYLLLARDLPGIALTGTLRPADETEPGGVVVVVDSAREWVDGFVNAQNLSAGSTGPETLSAGVAFNSNTAVAERLRLVVLNTVLQPREQVSGFMSYQQSLGGEGLLFKASGSRTHSNPGGKLKDLDLENNSLVINTHLEYPLLRGRGFSLWTRGGFEYLDQDSFLGDGENEIFDDQVRVLFAGLRGIWSSQSGALTRFDLQFRQGLTIFGAATEDGPGRSRLDAQPDFQVVDAQLDHTKALDRYWAVNIRATGQYSTKALPSIEEMALGGLTIGRGFDPGSVTGEAGVGVAAELRHAASDLVPKPFRKYISRLDVYGFLDNGRVYDRDPVGSGWVWQQVTSGGFGIRTQAFKRFFADLYYAFPLERRSNTKLQPKVPGSGLFFNMTQFF